MRVRVIDRIEKTVNHEEPDQAPVAFDVCGMFLSGFIGVEPGDYYRDPERMLDSQQRFQRRFPDQLMFLGISPEFGLAIEASAFGAKVKFPEKGSPVVVEPSIKRAEDIDHLQVPDTREDGLVPMALEALEYMITHCDPELKEAYGYCEGWPMNVIGPFDIAVQIRGLNSLIIDLYRNPDLARRLLDIIAEFDVKFLRVQEEIVGKLKRFDIADDLSGQINAKLYEDLVLPSFQHIFSVFDYAVGWLHNGSDTTHLLELLAQTGARVLYLGSDVDLAYAKCKIGNKVCLYGNVDPNLVLSSSPKEVMERSKQVIYKAARGGGFILSTGEELIRGTPSENIDAIINAAEKYGGYPIEE